MINCIAVIGAGTMGGGIAAHAANAGAEVILLDVSASLARAGLEKQLQSGGFMAPEFADRVRVGSVKDDLKLLASADWIIEAVAERLDVKRDIYRAIDEIRKPQAIISSNTSTIPLEELTGSMSPGLAERFLITHFFNPPRAMRLLEIVAGPTTAPGALASVREFADRALGKGLVDCNDTPGFIANRIGGFWLLLAQQEAIDAGIDVEEVDMLMTVAFGIPRSGVFGLLDLIGMDVMGAIRENLQARLPSQDAMVQMGRQPELVARMAAEGRLGRKSGAGYYRFQRDHSSRETLDLTSGEYRSLRFACAEATNVAKKGPRELMESDAPTGRFASLVMRRTLSYAASLVPEIAETPYHVDRAMTLGYGWTYGPFEIVDRMGAPWFRDHLNAHGEHVPEFLELAAQAGGFYAADGNGSVFLTPDGGRSAVDQPAGALSLPMVRSRGSAIISDDRVSLWDMGDGVALLEMHAKMNVLSEQMLSGLARGLARAKESFAALVIGTEGPTFSAGADLKALVQHAEVGDYSRLGAIMDAGQDLMHGVKFSTIPVVAAGHGIALGGGCELAMHMAGTAAHAEFNIGLVETAVGLVPAWGGCKELLLRFSEQTDPSSAQPVEPPFGAFELIATARKATNAFEACKLGFIRKVDGVTMNIDRVITAAKERALALSRTYRPPEPRQFRLAGSAGTLALKNVIADDFHGGRITEPERYVRGILAHVLTGGPGADPDRHVSENAIFHLEKAAILELLQTSATIERIKQQLSKATR